MNAAQTANAVLSIFSFSFIFDMVANIAILLALLSRKPVTPASVSPKRRERLPSGFLSHLLRQ